MTIGANNCRWSLFVRKGVKCASDQELHPVSMYLGEPSNHMRCLTPHIKLEDHSAYEAVPYIQLI